MNLVDHVFEHFHVAVAGMWLDDAELTELLREVVTVIQPRLANAPKAGRKRRILGTVLLPGTESDVS